MQMCCSGSVLRSAFSVTITARSQANIQAWLAARIYHACTHSSFFLSLFIRSVLQNIQRQKSDNMFLTIIHLYVPQLVTAALLCSACWFVFKKKAVVMYVDAEHVKASTWKRVKCKVKMNNICWKWSNLYFISKYSQRYHQINALNSW